MTGMAAVRPYPLHPAGSYWGNESINLTGTIDWTTNLINPLRLMQIRGNYKQCDSELNNYPSFDDADDQYLSSLNGTLKTAMRTLTNMFGIVRWKSTQAPGCWDGESKATYGTSWTSLNLSNSYGQPGFTYTDKSDSNQNEICSTATAKCFGPGGFIRDIWAASDYHSQLNELLDGEWLDESTETVIVRVQSFNPQSSCFVFTDMIFDVGFAGNIHPELIIRTSCQHEGLTKAGQSQWHEYRLPAYYIFVYVLCGIYLFIRVYHYAFVLIDFGCRTYHALRHGDSLKPSSVPISDFDPTGESLKKKVGKKDGSMEKQSVQEVQKNVAASAHKTVDFTLFVVLVGVFVSFTAHRIIAEDELRKKGSFDNQEFVDLMKVADSEIMLRGFLSMLTLAALMRCIGYLEIYGPLQDRFGALWSAVPYLITVFVLLFHFICAFVVLGMVLYGPFSSVFSAESTTAFTYLSFIVGDAAFIANLMELLRHRQLSLHLSGIFVAFALVLLFVFMITALIVAVEGEAWSDSTVII